MPFASPSTRSACSRFLPTPATWSPVRAPALRDPADRRRQVEVEARYEGHTQRGEASLRTDPSERHVEWEAGSSGYHGSFDVEPHGEGAELMLQIVTAHEHEVESDVEGTLDAIRRLLESRV